MSNTVNIFKCLSDRSRLNILNLLIKKPMYVELISETLDLAASTVSFHLKKMEKDGLVYFKKDQYYNIYFVNKEIFNQSLIELITTEKGNTSEQELREKAYEEKVLKSFINNKGQLITFPVQRKKLNVVLNYIVSIFDGNKEYTEKEVNDKLLKFHEDFCTLRRELVESKLLSRKNNKYKVGDN